MNRSETPRWWWLPGKLATKFGWVMPVVVWLALTYNLVMLVFWWVALFNLWTVTVFEKGTVIWNVFGEQWAEGVFMHLTLGFLAWVTYVLLQKD